MRQIPSWPSNSPRKLGYEQIILIGGGEGRMDHLLSLWAQYEHAAHARRWYTARECVYRITEDIVLSEVSPESYLSLTALGDEIVRLSSEGTCLGAGRLPAHPLTPEHQ